MTSIVKIEQIKGFLRVTQNDDDDLLQDLIVQAEAEALEFLDRDSLPRTRDRVVKECVSEQSPVFDSNDVNSDGHWPGKEAVSDSDDLAPSVRGAIYLLVQGMYEGKDAAEMKAIRAVAEGKMFPYRATLGV